MIKKSLPLRVLAISFIFVALPLLIDSFLFFQHSYEDSMNDIREELKQDAVLRAFSLVEIEPVKEVLLKEIVYLLDMENPHTTLESPSLQAKRVK